MSCADSFLHLGPCRVMSSKLSNAPEEPSQHVDPKTHVCRSRDPHLLDDDETRLLCTLTALPMEPLSLVLRLLTRKRSWHFLASLVSGEADYAPDVPQQVVSSGLALLDSSITRALELGGLLDALSVETLRTSLSQLLPAKHPGALGSASASKAGLVAALQSAAPPQRVVSVVRGLVGPMLRLTAPVLVLFARIQRLYFLSEGQDISA